MLYYITAEFKYQVYMIYFTDILQVIGKYKASSGKTTEEINLENDLGWYDYCTSAYKGDPEYLEHVLSYYTGDIRNLELNNGKLIS